jgi:hypothetical protein
MYDSANLAGSSASVSLSYCNFELATLGESTDATQLTLCPQCRQAASVLPALQLWAFTTAACTLPKSGKSAHHVQAYSPCTEVVSMRCGAFYAALGLMSLGEDSCSTVQSLMQTSCQLFASHASSRRLPVSLQSLKGLRQVQPLHLSLTLSTCCCCCCCCCA